MLKHRFHHPIIWILLAFLAFACLPVRALDYGLFGATAKEYFSAMGWAQVNISWLWFAALLIFPLVQQYADSRRSAKITVILTALLVFFIWFSAEAYASRFGYAVIFLFIAFL